MVTEADGTAERVVADKASDTHDFVETVREMTIRPHVTQNLNRPGGNAIDEPTTRTRAIW